MLFRKVGQRQMRATCIFIATTSRLARGALEAAAETAPSRMSLAAATGREFRRAMTCDGKPAAGKALAHPRRSAGCRENPRGVAGAKPAAWRGRIPGPVGSRTDTSRRRTHGAAGASRPGGFYFRSWGHRKRRRPGSLSIRRGSAASRTLRLAERPLAERLQHLDRQRVQAQQGAPHPPAPAARPPCGRPRRRGTQGTSTAFPGRSTRAARRPSTPPARSRLAPSRTPRALAAGSARVGTGRRVRPASRRGWSHGRGRGRTSPGPPRE